MTLTCMTNPEELPLFCSEPFEGAGILFTINWYRDGVMMDKTANDTRYQFELLGRSLTVFSVNQSAMYTCEYSQYKVPSQRVRGDRPTTRRNIKCFERCQKTWAPTPDNCTELAYTRRGSFRVTVLPWGEKLPPVKTIYFANKTGSPYIGGLWLGRWGIDWYSLRSTTTVNERDSPGFNIRGVAQIVNLPIGQPATLTCPILGAVPMADVNWFFGNPVGKLKDLNMERTRSTYNFTVNPWSVTIHNVTAKFRLTTLICGLSNSYRRPCPDQDHSCTRYQNYQHNFIFLLEVWDPTDHYDNCTEPGQPVHIKYMKDHKTMYEGKAMKLCMTITQCNYFEWRGRALAMVYVLRPECGEPPNITCDATQIPQGDELMSTYTIVDTIYYHDQIWCYTESSLQMGLDFDVEPKYFWYAVVAYRLKFPYERAVRYVKVDMVARKKRKSRRKKGRTEPSSKSESLPVTLGGLNTTVRMGSTTVPLVEMIRLSPETPAYKPPDTNWSVIIGGSILGLLAFTTATIIAVVLRRRCRRAALSVFEFELTPRLPRRRVVINDNPMYNSCTTSTRDSLGGATSQCSRETQCTTLQDETYESQLVVQALGEDSPGYHSNNYVPVAQDTVGYLGDRQSSCDSYRRVSESNYEIPCDTRWEISPSRVRLDKEIGRGEFGVVYRAKLLPSDDIVSPWDMVAVKKLKDDAVEKDLLDLVGELTILKKICSPESHPNIISLRGCCTQSSPVMILTELAERGNLRDYLSKHRLRLEVSLPPPPGEPLKYLHIRDLLWFSHQVASGMEYLSKFRIVHRDLAARNVFVTKDYILKVGDFGLTRRVKDYSGYTKTTEGLLPVRWMAPEAITHGRYTAQSDVWSYGVLLWEMFTLGCTPYSVTQSELLGGLLQSGYRLSCPTNAPPNIYELMISCWMTHPGERPTFTHIAHTLDTCLQEDLPYLQIAVHVPLISSEAGAVVSPTELRQSQCDHTEVPEAEEAGLPEPEEAELSHHQSEQLEAPMDAQKARVSHQSYLTFPPGPPHQSDLGVPRPPHQSDLGVPGPPHQSDLRVPQIAEQTELQNHPSQD